MPRDILEVMELVEKMLNRVINNKVLMIQNKLMNRMINKVLMNLMINNVLMIQDQLTM